MTAERIMLASILVVLTLVGAVIIVALRGPL